MRRRARYAVLFSLCCGVPLLAENSAGLPARSLNEVAQAGLAEIQVGMFHAAEVRIRAALALHPDTSGAEAMILWGELGQALQAQGKLADAETCLRKAAAIGSQPGTAAPVAVALVLQNLGAVLEKRSDYKDAAQVYEQARSILSSANLLQSHCGGAITRGMATCALRQGRFADASHLIDNALDIVQKADGAASADYGGALADKALIELESGSYEASLATGKAALAVQSTLAAADYERVGTLNNLGVALNLMGRPAEAQKYLRQSVELWRSRKPALPAIAPSALHNLAVADVTLGQFDVARDLELEALNVLEQIYGKQCFEQAASINNLGMIALDTGRTREAQSLFKQASLLVGEFRGQDSPEYASTVSNLAAAQARQHHFREAVELEERALSISKARLGADHPAVASIEANLGVELYNLKRFDQAEEHLLHAAAVQQQKLGESNAKLAGTLRSLALVFVAQKQPARASQLYTQAVNAMENSRGGEFDPKLVTWLRELAVMLRQQGRFAEAENQDLRATRLEVKNAIRLEKAARQQANS